MIENLIGNLNVYLQGSMLLAFLAAYVGGIVISFTPCTYPLIPITIGYIGARSSSSRLRGFLLSLFYVAGVAVTYSILGAIAALSGKLFGQIQTNPLTYFFMANLCILMGLAMLDVFTIKIPIPQKLMKSSGSLKAGFIGSFSLGAVSGIVIGPCTAPVLAVILGYVATQTNILLGISLLFIFSLGMGTLLIIVGTFTGLITALPRSGNWMKKINFVLGLLLIGAGEYFLFTAGQLSF
jgi:cytochrome c-type biogenesis protein